MGGMAEHMKNRELIREGKGAGDHKGLIYSPGKAKHLYILRV